MRAIDIIQKKRDGFELTTAEIRFMVSGYTKDEIPDYQMSAFLMAIYFQDMTDREITDLTMAMSQSGDQIDLSAIEGIKVDKHSTGGVGDTTTLVLAPLVASVGVAVAKMSGRGLGHTGGTIDKLEAIPGFNVEIDNQKFIDLVNQTHVAIAGQSGDLAPADKKMYALRDVTATVESIPLIASSIMSKKIASGADAICLDVTTGDGAFMKNQEQALKLAQTMVRIGQLANRKTMAIISDMSQPLGNAIGNSLEMLEAIQALNGEGPADLMEMVYTLGSQMVVLAEKAETLAEARQLLEASLNSGQAKEKLKELIRNQGGDERIVEDPSRLPQAPYQIELRSPRSGVVAQMVADKIGIAAMMLGAGRRTKEEEIDYSVGLWLHKKVGERVQTGDSLVTLYSNQPEAAEVTALLLENIVIADEGVEPPLIHAVVTEG